MSAQAAAPSLGAAPARAVPPGAIDDGELGWHFEDLHDFNFILNIFGRPYMKKNNVKPIVLRMPDKKPHASIAYTTEYNHWERAAAAQLASQWSARFSSPIPAEIEINASIVTYLPDRRGWPDLSATLEGPQDVLQTHRSTCKAYGRGRCLRHAGVIVDDKWICGHVGSDRRVDAGAPRVQITLTPHWADRPRERRSAPPAPRPLQPALEF